MTVKELKKLLKGEVYTGISFNLLHFKKGAAILNCGGIPEK